MMNSNEAREYVKNAMSRGVSARFNHNEWCVEVLVDGKAVVHVHEFVDGLNHIGDKSEALLYSLLYESKYKPKYLGIE